MVDGDVDEKSIAKATTQLRWLKDGMVLQYRTRAYDEVEWSEWRDVPIVRGK